MNKLKNIFLTILLLMLVFLFREPLKTQWEIVSEILYPCKNPIAYSVGAFDTRFGISEEDFLKAIKEAEAIWEEPIGRELFSYELGGNLKVNLIYDYRQDATQTLQELGLTVDQSKASYNEIEKRYELMVSQFEKNKSIFTSRAANFELSKKTYEDAVKQANRQRNVSQKEIDRLGAERDSLENEIEILNEMQADLQKEADDINVIAGVLNNLAKTLNLNIARYNDVGEVFSEEVTQGGYERHGKGEGITVFQYFTYDKLVRVLAHELGHALSLDHLDDPESIMYWLSEGDNNVITTSDLLAIKTRCGIE